MVKQQLTSERDHLPYDLHYTLGKGLYCSDIDCIEYQYKSGKLELTAMIDYKSYESVKHIDFIRYETVKLQNIIADKLEIPFFVVVTCLDKSKFDPQAMYVAPINEQAIEIFKANDQDVAGVWMSIRNYSKFLHFLRLVHSDKDTQKLLSDKVKKYTLPYVEEEKNDNIIDIFDFNVHSDTADSARNM